MILAGQRVAAQERPVDCSGICALAWSPADEHLLGAVDEFGLWLYDVNQADSAPQLYPRENSMSLSFDPQGRYAAVTSCPDYILFEPCHGAIALFDLQEQVWIELGAYDYLIQNVKFSPDGRYVAFQKYEHRAYGLQVIDLTTNETFSIVDQSGENRTALVRDYAFDPQSSTVAISNGSMSYEFGDYFGISVWRLSDQTLQAFTSGGVIKAETVAAYLTFTETDTEIIFVDYDTELFVWNTHTGTISSFGPILENTYDNLHRLSFSTPPTYLIASIVDRYAIGHRTLFVWDIQSREQVFVRDTPEDSFMNLVTMTDNGEYIAYSSSVDERKIVHVWERSSYVTRQIELIQ